MLKILVVCDDLWHPGEVILMGMKPLESEFAIDYVMTAKDILTPARIAGYDAIVVCKGNSVNAANSAPWFEDGVTEVCPPEFADYIKNGGGFVALHACNTSKEGQAMTSLIGNVMNGHPPRCQVDVRVTKDNPITAGVDKEFTIRDEHYNINIVCDDADVFLRSSSALGGDQAAGYTRRIGDGRLCVLTPGHTVDVFYDANFKRLLTNAIHWCAKR